MIKYRNSHLRFRKYHSIPVPRTRRFRPVELPSPSRIPHQFKFHLTRSFNPSPSVLEAFRRFFLRLFKRRRGSLIPLQLTFFPVSAKPRNSRMGKGKGAKLLAPRSPLPPHAPLFLISLRRRYRGFRLWQKRLEVAGALRRCSRRLSSPSYPDLSLTILGDRPPLLLR